MTGSYSVTGTATFTRTHAVHIAAKVATDLKRIQRFYYKPLNEQIKKYEMEVIELLKYGYMDMVIYGFQRNGYWVEPTLSYTARDLSGITASDDDPGRIRPGSSIIGASFTSFLIYNTTWDQLSSEQRDKFSRRLPFQRSAGTEPDVNGNWNKDMTYSAGNRALDRSSLRSDPR